MVRDSLLIRHWTVMNGKALGAILLAASLVLPGCAADTTDPNASEVSEELPALPEPIVAARRAHGLGAGPRMTRDERERVLDMLRLRHVRTDDVVFYADNAVLVQGDIIVDGPSILREGAAESDKGYFWSGVERRNMLGYNTIQIVANPAHPFPDWNWFGAFAQAAADFSQKTLFDMSFAASPGATPLTVSFMNFFANEPCLMGRAVMYHDAYEPGEVFMNTAYNCPGAGAAPCVKSSHTQLSFEVKRRVAIHEMMHAIGFAHTGDFAHIPGTAHESSGYSSVMYGSACLDEQPRYTQTLSNDDVDAIHAIYYLPPL